MLDCDCIGNDFFHTESILNSHKIDMKAEKWDEFFSIIGYTVVLFLNK